MLLVHFSSLIAVALLRWFGTILAFTISILATLIVTAGVNECEMTVPEFHALSCHFRVAVSDS